MDFLARWRWGSLRSPPTYASGSELGHTASGLLRKNLTRAADCTHFIEFLLDTIHDALQQSIDGEFADANIEKAPLETPVQAPVKTPDQILRALGAQPSLTPAELAPRLGISLRAVERAVACLQQQGRLRSVGPCKGGHWELRGARVRTGWHMISSTTAEMRAVGPVR
ncbi:MAG: winged helix-turn-helix transcriptional regulator [Xanthomonadales bacterium]|nr:winged helix-turn-helix transcriptional regulator [Xanthomonadales bacterium]